MHLAIIVEGEGAREALSELLALPAITGVLEEEDSTLTKSTFDTAVAIISSVAAIVQTAAVIRTWYKDHQEKQKEKRLVPLDIVLETPDGERMELEGITTDKLETILQHLPKKTR